MPERPVAPSGEARAGVFRGHPANVGTLHNCNSGPSLSLSSEDVGRPEQNPCSEWRRRQFAWKRLILAVELGRRQPSLPSQSHVVASFFYHSKIVYLLKSWYFDVFQRAKTTRAHSSPISSAFSTCRAREEAVRRTLHFCPRPFFTSCFSLSFSCRLSPYSSVLYILQKGRSKESRRFAFIRSFLRRCLPRQWVLR